MQGVADVVAAAAAAAEAAAAGEAAAAAGGGLDTHGAGMGLAARSPGMSCVGGEGRPAAGPGPGGGAAGGPSASGAPGVVHQVQPGGVHQGVQGQGQGGGQVWGAGVRHEADDGAEGTAGMGLGAGEQVMPEDGPGGASAQAPGGMLGSAHGVREDAGSLGPGQRTCCTAGFVAEQGVVHGGAAGSQGPPVASGAAGEPGQFPGDGLQAQQQEQQLGQQGVSAEQQGAWRRRYGSQMAFLMSMHCPRCGGGPLVPIVYGFPHPALCEAQRRERWVCVKFQGTV